MASPKKRPIPSAVTKPQRARQIIEQLRHFQVRIEELDLIQFTNEDDDNDPMSWLPPKTKDGQIVYENDAPVFPTYAESRAELNGHVARVWKRAEEQDLGALIEAMIAVDQANAEAEALASPPTPEDEAA